MHRGHAVLGSAQLLPVTELQQSRRQVGQFSRQLSRWKTSTKLPKIDRALAYTGRGGIPGWPTSEFISPTPQIGRTCTNR